MKQTTQHNIMNWWINKKNMSIWIKFADSYINLEFLQSSFANAALLSNDTGTAFYCSKFSDRLRLLLSVSNIGKVSNALQRVLKERQLRTNHAQLHDDITHNKTAVK